MDYVKLNNALIEADQKEKDVVIRYEAYEGEPQIDIGPAWWDEKHPELIFVNSDNDKGGAYIHYLTIKDIKILNQGE